MSTKTAAPRVVALAAVLLALAGCGKRAEQNAAAGPTPGAADSAVHVGVDTVRKPIQPVRPFEPVVIPGQSSASESPAPGEAHDQSASPSAPQSPSVSASPAAPDTATTPHRPKVKRRTPK